MPCAVASIYFTLCGWEMIYGKKTTYRNRHAAHKKGGMQQACHLPAVLILFDPQVFGKAEQIPEYISLHMAVFNQRNNSAQWQ